MQSNQSIKMKSAFRVFLVAIALLSVVLIFNTLVVRQRRFSWDQDPQLNPKWILDRHRELTRAHRLAKALTFRTVSYEPGRQELPEFLKLHDYLRQSFPLIHSSPAIELTVVNGYSLLYQIKGRQPNATLPYMLAAHMDVVPVDGKWVHQPFGGQVIEGVVYGRGALDDKNAVMSILEAIEFLLERNYEFQRTFFVGFGHDEEISGFQGATYIASHLKSIGVEQLDFILDEGSFVLENIFNGIDGQLSMIAVTEKGSLSLGLKVDGIPGHSSMPPKESALGILARAVANLEKTRQPSLFGNGPEVDLFQYLAPSISFGRAILFANLWLFTPLIKYVFAQNPSSDALQRTTTAVTIFNAGYKVNVIPGSASAEVNHRVYPSDTVDNVLAINHLIINDDRVNIKVNQYTPPVPISPYGPDVPAFKLIARSVKQVYPDSIVAPGTSPANTDLRRYTSLSQHLYRMNPNVLTKATQKGIHGDDERISVEDYHNGIQTFVALITNADEALGKRMPNRSHQEL